MFKSKTVNIQKSDLNKNLLKRNKNAMVCNGSQKDYKFFIIIDIPMDCKNN